MYRGSLLLDLETILEKAYNRQFLSKEEILYLLSLGEERQVGRLFEAARELRKKYFGTRVFLYGFVYFSTWCRNDCAFCNYRKSNTLVRRYRKDRDEIIDAAGRLAESGVHLIDLTMGEDPVYRHPADGFDHLIDLVKDVRKLAGLPVMVSPGVVPERVLRGLAAAGADWYACYQETHNRELFSLLRVNQSYSRRYLAKRLSLQHGMLIEEGILSGVGESLSDIATSLKSMYSIGAHQVRVMSFVPQEGSAMYSWPAPDSGRELRIIAVMRLLFPDRLIPASLDVDGVEGLEARINAGANVVTSLIPPGLGFAGVAQGSKDINEGCRTVQGISPCLEQMGMDPAGTEEYLRWVDHEKSRLYGQGQRTTGGSR